MAQAEIGATTILAEHHAAELSRRGGSLPFARLCSACARVINGEFYQLLEPGYFETEDKPICAVCAGRIKSEREKHPPLSGARILLWGAAAALAAFLVSVVLIMTVAMSVFFPGLIAGFAIGKAIRHASRGRANTATRVLAVALVYFTVAASFTPVILLQFARSSRAAQIKRGRTTPTKQPAISNDGPLQRTKSSLPLTGMLVVVAGLVVVSPFVLLITPNGFLPSVIVCFALVRTWKLTGAAESITGPLDDTFE